MQISQAIILGVIEGLTEFFPISSTGHLIIAQKAMGITEISLFFNTVIQLGAIMAVVIYYRTTLLALIMKWREKSSQHYLLNLIIASVPVLLVGLVFHSAIEWLQQSLAVVVASTLGVAGLMGYMQHRYKASVDKGKKDSEKTHKDYMITGAFQVLSLIPGVSRSGITMLGAISRNFSFADAMQASFLLGIPAMGAAAAFEGLKFMSASGPMDQSILVATAIGFVVAFITAFATISVTLPILKKYGFTPFILYRIALGIILLFFVV